MLDGCRVLSAYCAGDGTRFWIITEPEHRLTRVLLPQDYSPSMRFSVQGDTND